MRRARDHRRWRIMRYPDAEKPQKINEKAALKLGQARREIVQEEITAS
jgi:hypothetical protein